MLVLHLRITGYNTVSHLLRKLSGINFYSNCSFACETPKSQNVIQENLFKPGFMQGLLYEGNDTLFESTGLYGQVSLPFFRIILACNNFIISIF